MYWNVKFISRIPYKKISIGLLHVHFITFDRYNVKIGQIYLDFKYSLLKCHFKFISNKYIKSRLNVYF